MKVRHYHLLSAGSGPSPRWHEAFPEGEILHPSTLVAQLQAAARTQCVVWISTSDRQWPQQVGNAVGSGGAAVRVVVLSSQPHEREAFEAFRAGASGYAHSYALPVLLRDVGQVVEHGGLWLGPLLMQRLLSATSALLPATRAVAGLSPREEEVAKAVAAGRSNKEVARLLGITERTVKAHLGTVFEKLGVRDRLHLALQLAAPAAGETAPALETASE